MWCLLSPKVEHMNICDPPIQLQGFYSQGCGARVHSRTQPATVMQRQSYLPNSVNVSPHLPTVKRHLHCDVFIQKNIMEQRETIVATRNHRDESQKRKESCHYTDALGYWRPSLS